MKDGAGRYIGNRDFGTFGNNAITPASRVTLIGVQAWVEDARTFRVHVCQHVECMHVTHVNVKHLYFMSALIYALVPESCILSSCLLRVYADVSIHPLRVDAYT